MTARRQDGDDERAGRTLASLRKQVGEQVASAERVIATLTAEVDELRRNEQALVRERDELKRTIAKMTAVELQRAQADGRERAIDAKYRRAQHSADTLEAENHRLAKRCAELEAALADALAENDETRQELECVEKQVAELEKISALLSESNEG